MREAFCSSSVCLPSSLRQASQHPPFLTHRAICLGRRPTKEGGMNIKCPRRLFLFLSSVSFRIRRKCAFFDGPLTFSVFLHKRNPLEYGIAPGERLLCLFSSLCLAVWSRVCVRMGDALVVGRASSHTSECMVDARRHAGSSMQGWW